ncbi:MAG: cupin domain-containing protein [Pseudomonadota bacterium]
MDVTLRNSSGIEASMGSDDYFTGTVTLERLSNHDAIALTQMRVTFAPGARTAWHTHAEGQVLYVTSGNGLFGTRDRVFPISMGDVVEIPAGLEHWHGAAADTPMQHIATQPSPEAGWLEQVSEAGYTGGR